MEKHIGIVVYSAEGAALYYSTLLFRVHLLLIFTELINGVLTDESRPQFNAVI